MRNGDSALRSLRPCFLAVLLGLQTCFQLNAAFSQTCEILRILQSLISFCHGQVERGNEWKIHCVSYNYTV